MISGVDEMRSHIGLGLMFFYVVSSLFIKTSVYRMYA